MNALIVSILLVYCNIVFGEGILDDRDHKSSGYGEDKSYVQNFWSSPNQNGGNWLGSRGGQKYSGIWIGTDKNGQIRYDGDDDRYGRNIDDYSYDRYGGQNREYFDNDNGGYTNNGNRYAQGIRIGINGYSRNNQYNNYNRLSGYERYRQRGLENLRADLMLNAGLRTGLGLDTDLLAGLGLNAGLRAALRLNSGLYLGGTAGLLLNAGARVGLDLSLGGDQDKQEDLVRPCQMEDYQCMRKFFSENSQCRPSYGPSPDPVYLDQNTLFLPNANVTYTLTNVKITGMGNAKITDLYHNRVTGNVVITIQIKDLNETSAKSYLSYKRVGKEPIILADTSSILFASLRLTIVLPRIPNLRLDLADIHAYVDDSAPEYFIGPKAYTSDDPDVKAAHSLLSTNLKLYLREGLLLQAQLLAALLIQLNICDFGVNLISI